MNRMTSLPVFLACLLFVSAARPAGLPDVRWSTPVKAAEGTQIDVVVGENGVIHLLSSQYVQIDSSGKILLTEPHGDPRQADLDFSPAIAVGKDGSVHIVTRHGGEWNTGHEIRYRRRNPEGEWDLDLLLSKPVPRNYTVGVGVTADGRVWACHSNHPPDENMNSYVEFYEIRNGEAIHLGRIEGRYFRCDDTQRMRAASFFIHLATGNPWPSGRVHYFHGITGRGLPQAEGIHAMGTGRKGFPWLYADRRGFVHLTYGAKETVWYNKYTWDGRKAFPRDIRVAKGLGRWHMSIGLSVVAASDDGTKVVVAALKSDGVKEMPRGTIMWRYSPDWGMHWSELMETEFHTNAGEGRRRPGLVAVGDRFFMFFHDGEKGRNVQMTTVDLGVLDTEGGAKR